MFRRSLPALLIPTPFRHIATGLWVTLTCAVTVLSLMPHVGPPGEFHIDKVVHMAAYGALAGLPFTAFPARRRIPIEGRGQARVSWGEPFAP